MAQRTGGKGNTESQGEACSVKVYARIRPFSSAEMSSPAIGTTSLTVSGNQISTAAGGSASVPSVSALGHAPKRTFLFDMCFSGVDGMLQRPGQSDVYAHLGPPLIECAQRGFNGCLLAYGQTGSGKTYTIMGPHGASTSPATSDTGEAAAALLTAVAQEDDHRGVLPRLIADLFAANARDTSGASYRVSVRYVEVYCEKAYDLLVAGVPEIPVRPQVASAKGAAAHQPLEAATQEVVTSAAAALAVMHRGDRRRTVAATLKNERSSRSHAIFQLVVHKESLSACALEGQTSCSTRVQSIVSCLSLVDLAGSERQRQSGAEGTQFKEMVNINLSLSTLRRVIQVLHDNAAASSKGKMILPPVRESVLTSVLAPCFGGNSKTLMLVALSPSVRDLPDTISSLEFGSVARKLVNRVTVNEDKNQAIINAMAEEIQRLKAKLDQRRQSCRMSMLALRGDDGDGDTNLTARGCRRSVGTSTNICGVGAASALLSIGDDLDASGDDERTQELESVLAGTSASYTAMQEELTRHVGENRALLRQLGERDVLIQALRQQVLDLQNTFIEKARSGGPYLDHTGNVLLAAITDCTAGAKGDDRHGVCATHAESVRSATNYLLSVVAMQQEEVYIEKERLRRAHLDLVGRLADLQNALNVAEDNALTLAAQTRRIEDLEEQVAHHMQERISLLMQNHALTHASEASDGST